MSVALFICLAENTLKVVEYFQSNWMAENVSKTQNFSKAKAYGIFEGPRKQMNRAIVFLAICPHFR